MSEIKKENNNKKRVVKKDNKTSKINRNKKVVVKKNEPKKEVKILSNNEQKYYRVLCRVVQIIAKIAKVCLMIVGPFIFLAMILIPIVFKQFSVNGNIVKFGDVSVIVRDENVTLKMGDEVRVLECNTKVADEIITFVNDNPKESIIAFFELSLLLFGTVIVINIFLFMFIEKLFDNFAHNSTPFTKESTNLIFRIGLTLCILKVINLGLAAANLFPYTFSSYGIVEIFIIFIAYFGFKYATGVQKRVGTKIYE